MLDQMPPHFVCQRHAVYTLIFQSLARNQLFGAIRTRPDCVPGEEEQNRIIEAYHEEMSSLMIAVLFLIETAKSELQESGLPKAETVSKASDISQLRPRKCPTYSAMRTGVHNKAETRL